MDPSRDPTKWYNETEREMKTYLFNCALDDGMNDEMRLRNFNILLQMKKGQFKLGEFFLRHWNS